MRRGDGAPDPKRLKKHVFESPGTHLSQRKADESQEIHPLHSTALNISNVSDAVPLPYCGGTSDIMDSQGSSAFSKPRSRPLQSGSQVNRRPRSPVIITESSGHVLFSSVLQRHGFFLSPEGNQTHNEARVIRKILTEWVDSCTDDGKHNEDLTNFIADMKRYLGPKENLVNAMSPTEHMVEVYQPSLLHTLLGVVSLQRHIFAVIFPSLADSAYSARDDEEVTFFTTLLNQIKWLPYLNQAEKITEDLLEIFERATPRAQNEMMILLPDIVPREHHRMIGNALQKMLDDFSPLCSSIMDCFSVLDVPDADLARVRDTAVENMLVADQKDLPAYVGFLLGVEDQTLLENIISDMREKLKFRPPTTVDEEIKSSMKALVSKIKFCVSVNSHLVSVWVKQVREDFNLEPTQFKALDLMMLLVFIGSDKMAEVPLKNLFANESLALETFEDVLASMPTVVDHVFDGILKFCEKYFWTSAAKFYGIASKILVKLFRAVPDRHAREIIKLFTCTLAHGNQLCRDNIIEALAAIAEQDCVRLLRFTNLVMAIMDFVIEFAPQQIRNVIKILATVAYIENNRESQRFETEFSILLRKQLSQRNEKIKAIGIIGAVSAIDQLTKQDKSDAKLQELVELVWSIVKRDGNACWIFFDEMAPVVSERDVPKEILEFLREMLGEEFRQNWTVEESALSTSMVGESGLKLHQVLNANEAMEVESLSIKFENTALGLSTFSLAAHTKLLCALESKLAGGDLQDVDIIVGCPLLLPEFDLYTDSDRVVSFSTAKKNSLAHYLVFAINYLRELLSAFCRQRDVSSRIKVFLRLSQLVKLQKMLVSFIGIWENAYPSLPFAYALEKNSGAVNFAQAAKKRKKAQLKKGKGKLPSSTIIEDSDSDSNSVITEAIPSSAPSRKGPSRPGADKDCADELQPAGIRPFFRRFHPHIFRLLKFRFHVNDPDVDHLALLESVVKSDSEQSSSYRDVLKQVAILTPETMILILQDLNQQVENEKNKLCILKDVAAGFSKDFFTCLCNHLDVLHTSCEADFSTWSISKKRQVESCFRLIYNTMKNYLEKLSKRENKEKFTQALKIVMEHAEGTDADGSQEEPIANYLGGSPDFINNPNTAVEQLKVMKIVHDFTDNKKHMGSKIQENANVYLKRQWKLPSPHILSILKIWLSTCEHPLEAMLDLTKKLIPENVAQGVPDTSEYKSCTSSNFHTWYRAIMEILCQHVMKNFKRKIEDVDVTFAQWSIAFEILKLMVSVIQLKRQTTIILPLLRNSRFFLEAFTSYGINMLPLLWGTDANQARIFIRHLQAPTRKIQYICEHCKVEKSTMLLRHVPRVKRALEVLVFRVREVLTVHGAPNAFWMGSLKHRNLDGEEIDSQINGVIEDDDDEETLSSDDEGAAENSENLFDISANEADEDED